MALTKVTGQVINNSTGLVVGVTTVGGGLSATDGFFSGIVTAVGDASFSGNVSVGGTLTYEDVTNIDAVGIITARSDVLVGSGITLSPDGDIFFTGIMTGNGSGLTGVANTDVIFTDKISLPDSAAGSINVGLSSDLQIYHTGSHSIIAETGTGILYLGGNQVQLYGSGTNDIMVQAVENGAVTLYNDNSAKLTTSASGVTVTGTLAATAVTGDGSGLTGIGGTDFIHSEQINNSGVTTSQAFIPTTGQLSHRNLIINGDMTIAQRSTSESHINGGYQTVDRFKYPYSNNSANLTQQQVDVSSGTTPYTLGFRKSYKLTNGNQSGTPTNARVRLEVNLEAQDIAQSGWNYLSSSSYITLSFWVNSSISMNFYGYIRTPDGTSQGYSFETGTLSANTWTKIVKTIPGHSNLTFDNNNELGWNMVISMYHGTDYTSSGHTLNQWAAYNSNSRIPDQVSTWYTTDNATWEITGLQLEVGPVATPFEHRSHADNLAACQRYYYKITGNSDDMAAIGFAASSSDNYFNIEFPVPMRDYPTLTGSATAARFYSANVGQDFNLNSLSLSSNMTHAYPKRVMLYVDQGGTSGGYGGALHFQEASGFLEFSAEL